MNEERLWIGKKKISEVRSGRKFNSCIELKENVDGKGKGGKKKREGKR